jgi:chromosome partitioning protein
MKQIICALFNTKGGSGKSSVCLGLADTLQGLGKEVVIIDSDPEQSSSWHVATGGAGPYRFPVKAHQLSEANPAQYAEKLKPLIDGAQVVLIDLPARSEAPEQLAALLIADVVLVPVMPSALDIKALMSVVLPKLRSALERRTRKPAVFVVRNRVNSQRALARELAEGLKRVCPLKVLKATIPDSTALQEVVATSRGIEHTRVKKDARDKVRLALVDVCREAGLLR